MTDNSNNTTQGGLANKQGKVLEATVISLFTNHGFKEVSYREWIKSKERYGDELLIKGFPYTSIYGHSAKTEFVAFSKRFNMRTRIECKWQQSSGSVDEKFPYLYLNCIHAMPEDEIIIIVDGGGAKPSSVQWLRQATTDKLFIKETESEKKIKVLSLSEFIIWGNTRLR